MLDSLLQTHFWLMTGLWVGGIGGLFCSRTLKRHVKNGLLTDEERLRFVQGWIKVILGSSLVFWFLQLTAGPAPNPDYLTWPLPQKWLAVAFNVSLWLWLLWWMFAKGGDEYLSRMSSLGNSFLSRSFLGRPLTFRVLAVVVFIGGVFSLTDL